MPIKLKYLGIDFGSSATTIIGISKEGKAYLLNDTTTGKEYFSTAVAELGGKRYFSQAAFSKHNTDGATLHVTPKEDLLSKGKNEISECKARVLDFFREVLSRAQGALYDLAEVEAVCFGHPSYYRRCDTEDYNAVMKEILADAFPEGNRPTVIPAAEPLLASIAYGDVCGIDAFRDESLLLVVDCGGHTIDLSLVRATHECTSESGDTTKKRLRLIAAAPPASINENNTLAPLGKQLTKDITDILLEKSGVAGAVDAGRLYDFRVEEAKRAFFAQYPGKTVGAPFTPAFDPHLSCRLTWGEATPARDVLDMDFDADMNAMLRFNAFGDHVRVYMRELERHGTISEHHLLDGILFAGGASRMYPLRESIKVGAWKWLRETTAYLEVEHPVGNATSPLWVFGEEGKFVPAPLSVETAVGYGAALVASSEVLRQDVHKGEHRFTEDTATRTLSDVLEQQKSAERSLQGIRATIEELAEYRGYSGAPITADDLKKILNGELPLL